MFGTIRRHQTWLWVVVATITIVSFIVYFNPASRPGRNSGYRAGDFGSIHGKRISEADYQAMANEVTLRHVLSRQKPDPGSPAFQYEVLQSLWLAQEQEDLGVHVTAEAAGTFARERIIGNAPLEEFDSQFLKPNNLNLADFDRFLRHQVGLAQLEAAVGVSGTLVMPTEARSIYEAQNREVALQMVYFNMSNYLGQVKITNGALESFFTNQEARYRIPEKMVVNYVRFDPSNYVDTVKASLTNLDQLVEEAYRQIGSNLVSDAKTPEEAKAKYKQMQLTLRSQVEARRAAGVFASALDDAGAHPEVMAPLAKSNNYTMKTTEPFDSTGPADLKVTPAFAQAAFKLTPEAPFSSVVIGEDAFYVLGFVRRIPSVAPSYQDVAAKVKEDYLKTEAQQLAVDAATNFVDKLKDLGVDNGVTLPKNFTTICAENNLKPETLPPISLMTTNVPASVEDRINVGILRQVGFGVPVGNASPAIPLEKGAAVVYVDKMLPVDTKLVQAKLPDFIAYMRRVRESDAFNLWISYEIQKDQDLTKRLMELRTEMSKRAER